jgi:hypothetical protein
VESELAEVREQTSQTLTTVGVQCTGRVRTAVGESGIEYAFEGDTLRAFLEQFFEEHDIRDVLITETEEEATAAGWAPELEELPGDNWAKNPRANRRAVAHGSR